MGQWDAKDSTFLRQRKTTSKPSMTDNQPHIDPDLPRHTIPEFSAKKAGEKKEYILCNDRIHGQAVELELV